MGDGMTTVGMDVCVGMVVCVAVGMRLKIDTGVFEGVEVCAMVGDDIGVIVEDGWGGSVEVEEL